MMGKYKNEPRIEPWTQCYLETMTTEENGERILVTAMARSIASRRGCSAVSVQDAALALFRIRNYCRLSEEGVVKGNQ